MDGALHIRSFRSRLRAADDDGLRRCRAVQAELLEGELEAALSGLASGDEIVLVRRLQAQVRLRSAHSDRANARAWSDQLAAALANAMQHALQHAPARDLLRFARRRGALLAFVQDIVAGETARDWAWQRLGLMPAGSSPTPRQRRDALLRLLADDARDADAGVPLLRAWLPAGTWPLLVSWLSEGELRGLAHSVLLRLAGQGTGAVGFDSAASALAGKPHPDRHVQAGALSAATPAARAWALRLGAMLADPALARRGARAVDAALGLRPGAATAPQNPPDAAAPNPASEDAATAVRAPPAPPSAAGGSTEPATANEPAPAWSEHGGLLLLLPLLEPCGALALLEDAALWPPDAGGLRLALHRLALHLLPPIPQAGAARDPAALAFCGLAPGAEPPGPRHALSEAQSAALDTARSSLLAALAERLPDWRGPALLARVLRRRARIEVVPGWMEVSFSLRDVSTELRRAALDLDPGFIPWLGAVLRYRYE
jgi:hypothetical protein